MELSNLKNNGDLLSGVPEKKIGKFQRVLVFFLSVVVVVAGALYVWHLFWINSGSNQWELKLDREGVRIFSLKAPGSTTLKYRGTTTIQVPLHQAVAAMLDNSSENCADWTAGCNGWESVEEWNRETMSSINLWKMDMPLIFRTREYLLKTQLFLDQQGKSVSVEWTSVPDALPHNDCCVRLPGMHIVWKFTPINEREISVEWTINELDMGGAFPYVLLNLDRVDGSYKFLHSELPGLLNKEHYRDVQYDFLNAINPSLDAEEKLILDS